MHLLSEFLNLHYYTCQTIFFIEGLDIYQEYGIILEGNKMELLIVYPWQKIMKLRFVAFVSLLAITRLQSICCITCITDEEWNKQVI